MAHWGIELLSGIGNGNGRCTDGSRIMEDINYWAQVMQSLETVALNCAHRQNWSCSLAERDGGLSPSVHIEHQEDNTLHSLPPKPSESQKSRPDQTALCASTSLCVDTFNQLLLRLLHSFLTPPPRPETSESGEWENSRTRQCHLHL